MTVTDTSTCVMIAIAIATIVVLVISTTLLLLLSQILTATVATVSSSRSWPLPGHLLRCAAQRLGGVLVDGAVLQEGLETHHIRH